MRAAIAQRPDYAAAHYMLGTALKQSGDLEGAMNALREAIRLSPDDPGPYNTLGQVLRAKGDLEGSKRAFSEGARLKKNKEAEQSRILNKGK
jgi:Flp pilus assembly protein TadD